MSGDAPSTCCGQERRSPRKIASGTDLNAERLYSGGDARRGSDARKFSGQEGRGNAVQNRHGDGLSRRARRLVHEPHAHKGDRFGEVGRAGGSAVEEWRVDDERHVRGDRADRQVCDCVTSVVVGAQMRPASSSTRSPNSRHVEMNAVCARADHAGLPGPPPRTAATGSQGRSRSTPTAPRPRLNRPPPWMTPGQGSRGCTRPARRHGSPSARPWAKS